MPLAPGIRLGPHEIVAPLGAGGMGEVYKARDTRLNRTVAIKVLPEHLKDDPHLRQRFLREAQAVAALEHPHICVLHDIGHHETTDFLVMEYLEGETLAQRLKKGALPLDQLLRYAIELADALDKAHRHGIIHRDLKPANIMLTKAGAKLLDFGLAKLKGPAVQLTATSLPTQSASLTGEGKILGTLQYMAPEQLEGKEADARTDIFAFGAIVYEMACGKKAFEGSSQASVIAAILGHQPPLLSERKVVAPLALDWALRKCLAKDPDDRWQSAGDLLGTLKWIAEAGVGEKPAIGAYTRRRVTWLLGALLVMSLLASAALIVMRFREQGAPPTFARLAVVPPKGVTVENAQISPDGRRIAFVGRETATRRLWVQALDSTLAAPLLGTEGAINPFWAPDSQHVAFVAAGVLKRINVSGGAAQTLCPATNAGGTWSRAGVILFHTGARLPLSRVSASGGNPVPATKLDSSRHELGHFWPHFLPDGKHFLYVVHSADKRWSGLNVGSLDSPEIRRLLDTETAAVYTTPGYLLYSRDGAIVAQPFDMEKLQLTGEAKPIAHDDEYRRQIGPPQFSTSSRNTVPGFAGDVGTLSFLGGLFGAAIFSVSETGVLAYSLFEPDQYQFGWFNRHGVPLGDLGNSGPFRTFDLSPDGRRLVVTRPKIDRANLWLFDLDRNISSQLTFGPTFEFDPRWAPDSRRVAATSVREDAQRRIVEIGLDGKETLLLDQRAFLDDWSRDGRFLLYRRTDAAELLALPLFGERTPILVRRWIAGAGTIDQALFSPDGRLIAYHSHESGKTQVYIERFPPTGERRQVSAAGGELPVWRRDGQELYYLGPDGMLFAVDIDRTNIEAGVPRPLFRAPVDPDSHDTEQYATVDGKRFLVMKPIERPQRSINVIINWPEAIRAQSRP